MKTKPDSYLHYSALAGVDWGHFEHAVSQVTDLTETNPTPTQFMLGSAPEKIQQWLQRLNQQTSGGPVAVAVEAGGARAPVVGVVVVTVGSGGAGSRDLSVSIIVDAARTGIPDGGIAVVAVGTTGAGCRDYP